MRLPQQRRYCCTRKTTQQYLDFSFAYYGGTWNTYTRRRDVHIGRRGGLGEERRWQIGTSGCTRHHTVSRPLILKARLRGAAQRTGYEPATCCCVQSNGVCLVARLSEGFCFLLQDMGPTLLINPIKQITNHQSPPLFPATYHIIQQYFSVENSRVSKTGPWMPSHLVTHATCNKKKKTSCACASSWNEQCPMCDTVYGTFA